MSEIARQQYAEVKAWAFLVIPALNNNIEIEDTRSLYRGLGSLDNTNPSFNLVTTCFRVLDPQTT